MIMFIETDIKPSIRIMVSMDFRDYPEETLNKLDKELIRDSACK